MLQSEVQTCVKYNKMQFSENYFAAALLLLLCAGLGHGNIQEIHDQVVNQLKEDVSTRSAVYVTTKNGTIKGYTARAVNNRTIHTFMHIPFAKPPVGQLRFQAPEPTDGWEGVLDGTRLTPACPAIASAVASSEDCLYLNVYSARTGNETDKPLAPVMVYMYGGAFVLGETSYYTGYRMVANDIVLVIPNYRVGALGFFSTGDEVAPGNYGFKDQNLALRWVQENIEAFGGDPNRVTIFGTSAGAASVIFHLISPLSHGLFHAVAAHSGTALTPWALDPNPKLSAQRLAKVSGCPTDNSQIIVDCLRDERTAYNVSVGYTLGVTLTDLINNDFGLAGTNAVVEPDLPGAFLTKDPYELLKEGNYPDVPVILGATAEEGSFFLGGFHFISFGNHLVKNKTLDSPVWMREEMMKQFMNTYKFREESGNVAVEEALALAFTPDDNRLEFTKIADQLRDLFSVLVIKGPVLKTADILSEKLSNVYLYSFEYRTANNRNSLWYWLFNLLITILGEEVPPITKPGIPHGDDLLYMFNFFTVFDERDEAFSTMFCKLIADFATEKTPTPNTSAYPAWPTYTWRDPKYYVLTDNPVVKVDYAQQWKQ